MRTISNLEKIKKYLNTEGTTYSMMLSGPWGSGKTYFIKNNLNDMLEKLLDKSFTMCYISLNGLTNLDDLKKMILFELLSDKKKQTKKYAALVSNIIGALSPIHYGLKAIANLTKEISNIEKSLEKVNLDNILFCFDDLERLSNKLKADEVLGFINSNLIEFANIKVLIIANEEEIKNVRNKKYINAKEKVIGRTLKHEILDMTKTLEDFSSLFNETSLLSEWLKVNDNTINLTAVIRDFKIENLRQVRNILSVFNELLIEFVSYLDELDENERNKLISIMLNNLLAVYTSVNYGDSTYLTDYSHVMDRTFKVAEQLNTMTTQDKMTKKFYETYHEKNVYFDEHIYYFDFVSNYILEVNLDLNSAKDEMNKYLDRYVRDGKSIEKAYNDIINFQYLETVDFRNVIKLFFKLLPEENTLKSSQYFNIY
ncbi:TPA: P-loop NTPase fold protein, partial [Listeria monocytogenes]